MASQVILIESDPTLSESMHNTLKKSPDFELAATYKNANAALSQSKMFKPDLFLINVDDEDSIQTISAFAELYPNSMVIGLMENWRPGVTYACTKGGAYGCILKSFTIEDLKKAIDLYKLRGQNRPARVISFFSPKGRAGRTTVASILAMIIAEKSGERVALIDGDLQFGDMPIFFDIEPQHTIIEAVQDIKLLTPLSLETYFHKLTDKVSLLASPDRPEYAELVDAESFVEVIRMTCALYRYVLIDLPTGFNPISISACDVAGTNVVMAMLNNMFDIVHMRRALEMFKTQFRNSKRIYTCFTRVNPCTEEEKLKIQRELGYPVTEILPNEYQMISLANSGRLLKGLPMDTLLMKNIDQIADNIIRGIK